jgi:TPR repeat protein
MYTFLRITLLDLAPRIWRLTFPACLLALSLSGPAAAAEIVADYKHGDNAANPLAEGVAAYQRGDYASAMRLLRPLAADQGMPLAQFSLGVM